MYYAANTLNKYFNDPISQVKQFNLMEKAAELGHMKATRKFAQMLNDGFAGINPHPKKAADLFSKVINSKEDIEEKDRLKAKG